MSLNPLHAQFYMYGWYGEGIQTEKKKMGVFNIVFNSEISPLFPVGH